MTTTLLYYYIQQVEYHEHVQHQKSVSVPHRQVVFQCSPRVDHKKSPCDLQ